MEILAEDGRRKKYDPKQEMEIAGCAVAGAHNKKIKKAVRLSFF
jgi:hypothetical protein